MRFLLKIFVVAVCAVTLVCCVDGSRIVGVLDRAQFLMDSRPDSAYKLLQTIDGDRIYEAHNEARYALLMTRARYENYVKNENDSLINIAVDYYRNSADVDAYARALFYLGTVNEDMGDVDQAIIAYKAADATSTTDTLLLSFAQQNIKNIYYKQILPTQFAQYYDLFGDQIEAFWQDNERNRLDEIEARFGKKQLEIEHHNLRELFNLWVVIAILLACVVVMVCVVYITYRRRDKRERQQYIETLKEQEQAFVDTRANMQMLLSKNSQLEQNVCANIENRVALIGQLINQAYECGDRYDKFVQRFNKLVIDKPLGADSFADISKMVNDSYGGIIDYLTNELKLNSSEIDICALTCIGFTSQQLFIMLAPPKIETVYYKKTIINDKIGAKGDLRKNLLLIVQKLKNKE